MDKRQHFGTDGVRGVAGIHPLTSNWVLDLGRASAEVLKTQKQSPTVVIGKDTRKSGDMLEAALAAGLTAQGVNVIHLGVIPTPGVSFLTRALQADAGVVISASHNPFEDNGIKFFGNSGEKLSDALEREIEAKLDHLENLPSSVGIEMGTVLNYTDAERLYLNFLSSHAPNLSGLKIAMDCANGAAYRIAPRVFQRAGAELFAVYTNPDGRNINKDCGSTHLGRISKIVAEGDFDLGVAFDGDADRALLVDRQGRTVQGDQMLLLLAQARGEKSVVTTLMANMGLEVKLRERGVLLERTAVGDRYVHERMVEKGLTLGGEQSGHILMLDHSPTGDGVLTALRVLAASLELKVSLEQLVDDLTLYPQTLVNVRVLDKQGLSRHPDVQKAVLEAEERLAGRGRINLRPSGTEPLVRVMVEGESLEEITEIARAVAAVIEGVGKVKGLG